MESEQNVANSDSMFSAANTVADWSTDSFTSEDGKLADARSEHALEQAISQQAVLNEVLECQRKLLVYTEQVRTKHANHQCRWVLLKTRKWA
jgi:hypothetical protein